MVGDYLMAQKIDYELRYRHIYIKMSEFALSVQKMSVYKEYAIPILNKVIKNYEGRFKQKITSINERRVCDEYIKSISNLVEIMKRKISSYEKYQKNQLDII